MRQTPSLARFHEASSPCRKIEYEFMGPWVGPSAIVLGLPAVCYGLYYTCNQQGCLTMWPEPRVPGFPPGTRLISLAGFGVFLLWLAAQVLIHLLVPGQHRPGVQLADGSRLSYKLTGDCVTSQHCWYTFQTPSLPLNRLPVHGRGYGGPAIPGTVR